MEIQQSSTTESTHLASGAIKKKDAMRLKWQCLRVLPKTAAADDDIQKYVDAVKADRRDFFGVEKLDDVNVDGIVVAGPADEPDPTEVHSAYIRRLYGVN